MNSPIKLDRKVYGMTNNITTIEKNTSNITKAFANIVIETKDDINTYMNIATTLTESAQFARAWVLNLAKLNVFKGVNNEVIKYADEKFGIKRASTLQYIKIAKEYLIDATKSKLCAYYHGDKFIAFLDDEENAPKEEDKINLDVIDFSYTQISVMLSKGYDEVRSLIESGKVKPTNTVAEIKKALKPTIEATFTDNASEANEAETSEPTSEAKKDKTVWYIDENGQNHTFEEITHCDTDEAIFIKASDKITFIIKAKLEDLANGETATVKVARYTKK